MISANSLSKFSPVQSQLTKKLRLNGKPYPHLKCGPSTFADIFTSLRFPRSCCGHKFVQMSKESAFNIDSVNISQHAKNIVEGQLFLALCLVHFPISWPFSGPFSYFFAFVWCIFLFLGLCLVHEGLQGVVEGVHEVCVVDRGLSACTWSSFYFKI